ncbi:ATP-binding protein, partial [bacterium]|nr:ATP-binding protein [bacterium]
MSHAAQDIVPRPMISISVDRAAGQSIVVLRVNRPSDNAYYTHKGAVWVRVGSTNRKLEGQTLLDYLRGRQILSFDESTDTTATVADLD